MKLSKILHRWDRGGSPVKSSHDKEIKILAASYLSQNYLQFLPIQGIKNSMEKKLITSGLMQPAFGCWHRP